MRKKRLQNIVIGIVAAAIIGSAIAYSYSADQTRQRGTEFGMQLERIQGDVKDLQARFYSEKARWEEGDITREELLAYYERHLEEFEGIISRYDLLEPPELFEGSVELLKISSQAQLDSDAEFIGWIGTGDESSRVRSDALLQESLEYEMLGLVEYYSAKTGVRTYDEPGMFEPPRPDLVRLVDRVAEGMVAECEELGKAERSACVEEAKRWKVEHMP